MEEQAAWTAAAHTAQYPVPAPISRTTDLPEPQISQNRRSPRPTDRAPTVNIDLDELITIPAPADLTGCSLADLRTIRDHHQDVENGLSYARRIVQGRLDTVATEMERRRDGGAEGLIERLPGALAGHSRGPGLPRPMPDLEPPAWADDLLAGADMGLSTSQMAGLSELDESELERAAVALGSLERELSDARHQMHRGIDRVQDELVGRYRSGATVDDLLR